MKPVLIIENSTNSLVMESTANKNDYILSGPFTEFGVLNRNERVYTAEKFLPALNELNERITNLGVVYGEFDHPDVFDTSLSRSSHIITKAKYISEHNMVKGEIKLLSTYWGKEAKSLVNDGLPIFVSSRAAGVTESDGSVALKKLFTYDIVADPGFASAKMDTQPLNESLGFGSGSKTNFRIYELSNEAKMNELFNMNKSDYVTKKQLADYSNYLVEQLAVTKRQVSEATKKGNLEPKKMAQLLEYYEELHNNNNKVANYLDYLAEKIQFVVNENKSLKKNQDKLIKHNDYLAESLEKAIHYSEYLAENVDKSITYSEYIAEKLDKTIGYTEYIAENVDDSISKSNLISEKLDKTIGYTEYLAENVDKSITYSEYIAEKLDKTIGYTEYIAENLDSNIAYSEYIAEKVEGNIAYSEYIAEHLDDNIAYSEYIAENVDKSITYQGMITEKLNNGRINESFGSKFPTLEDVGFNEIDEDDIVVEIEKPKAEIKKPAKKVNNIEIEEEEEEVFCDDNFAGESDTELTESINKLIEEAKKRKVSETTDLNFLKFLSKSQIESYYSLSESEQEAVKLHINESSTGYFSQKDVLGMISESLSAQSETLEERVIRLMPENMKPIWEGLDNTSRKSLLSQARLYPAENMMTEDQIGHFWNTRNIKKNESVRKLVNQESLIKEDRISDDEAKAILERFKGI